MVFRKLRSQGLMKGILIVVVLAFAGTLLWAGGNIFVNRGSSVNTVVAKVNSSKITYDELQNAYWDTAQYYQQMQGELPASAQQDVRYIALQNLITRELLKQQVKENKIKVDRSEIDAEVEKLRANFETDAEYQQFLTANEVTEAEARDMFEEQLGLQKLREQKSAVEVTDDDVKKAYEQIRASHILIEPVSDNWEAAKRQAEKVLADLRANKKSFEDAAKEFSVDPGSKDNGGDLGFFGRDSGFVKEFTDAAFALKVGEISEPVKTQYGYHLIKVTDKKEAAGEDFETAKADLRTQLETSMANDKFNEWYTQVQADAKITINDPAMRAAQFVANGQYPQAVGEYQEAIEADASNAYLHLALGHVYTQVDDMEQAVAEYQAAVELNGDDPELHLVLGMAYQQQEENDKAAEEFRTASGLDTYSYGLHSQLKQLFDTMGLADDVAAEDAKLAEIEKMYEEQQKAYEEQQKAQQELQKKLNEDNASADQSADDAASADQSAQSGN